MEPSYLDLPLYNMEGWGEGTVIEIEISTDQLDQETLIIKGIRHMTTRDRRMGIQGTLGHNKFLHPNRTMVLQEQLNEETLCQ